jgi:hypothetical protein
MKIISVFDTAINDYNLGNQIIMEAILSIIDELFPDDFLFTLPCDGGISKLAHGSMSRSDYVLFGGTNALSSYMLEYNQLGFRLSDLIKFGNLTLLGVGWWQYQGRPDFYTRSFLRRLLSKTALHSVRDEYTKMKLASIGIESVVNTCCPTTWGLTSAHCAKIPLRKANSVVMTLTDYSKSRESDERLLSLLFDSYVTIYYWAQGVGDMEYINSFTRFRGRIIIIPPKLNKYDQVLESRQCDYIGTRLHAGIRAIQRSKRALILSVDNRATEISRDIGLNVRPRHDVAGISEFISDEYQTSLHVPFSEIARWKAQFSL